MSAFQRPALILALLGALLAAFPAWAQSKPAPTPPPITDAKSWHAALLRQVGANTRFPNLPQPPLKEGEAPPPLPSGQVMVQFVLDRNGQVQSAKVVQGSGQSEFDQAALEALKRATPFPKPPANVTGESFSLRLPILFRGGPQPQNTPKAKPSGAN
ncbi:energy transducer TonB [Labrys sp. KNU-23]|uniref:energy transducer TonB family protein n=1 Tax=Labrys sp. KNU-23 TaxID=2789216 RepID=UPI0011EF59B6|nr:energy transducer TonB [Labrys sp. KNU-23]QEN89942.1 energy transducer TonB [Labrys sp. KNU-23]